MKKQAKKNRTFPRLKPEYVNLIKSDTELMGKIAKDMGNLTFKTVERWLQSNHKYLTFPVVLDILSARTGVAHSELLTEPK